MVVAVLASSFGLVHFVQPLLATCPALLPCCAPKEEAKPTSKGRWEGCKPSAALRVSCSPCSVWLLRTGKPKVASKGHCCAAKPTSKGTSPCFAGLLLRSEATLRRGATTGGAASLTGQLTTLSKITFFFANKWK